MGFLVGGGLVGEAVTREGVRVGYREGARDAVGIGEDGRSVGTAKVGVRVGLGVSGT